MKTYNVWRRQWPDNSAVSEWMRTAHTVQARTQYEAESKLKRRFLNSQFSLMSLVVVMEGHAP